MNSIFLSGLALGAAVAAQGTTTLTRTQVATRTQTTDTNASSSSSVTSFGTANAVSSGFASNSINGSASTLSSAQTTLSLFNACSGPTSECDTGGYTFYGGIVSANPTATVLSIDCESDGNQTVCGTAAITVTQGPSMYQRVQRVATPGVLSISCAISGTTSKAVCAEAIQTDGAAASGAAFVTGSAGVPVNSANGTVAAVTTSTVTFGSDAIHYNPLVITSGVEKLSSSSSKNTPVPPTSASPTPTHKGAASDVRVASSSLAGVFAFIFAVMAA